MPKKTISKKAKTVVALRGSEWIRQLQDERDKPKRPTTAKIKEVAIQLAFTLKDFAHKTDRDAAMRMARKILAVTT